MAPHLKVTNKKLMDAFAGRTRRLIVCEPPRHGKSELCSKYAPASYLGNFPDRRIALASYEADFAAEWGDKALEVFEQSAPEVWGLHAKQGKKSGRKWGVDRHGGNMFTAGVMGSFTGKGADLLIIDDPVKNAQEANSPTYRDRTWDWYGSTAYTRLEPGGSIVLIQTRWNEDDLAGRLIKAMREGNGDLWDVISFPAIAEEGDALGRAIGDPLWPARYDLEALEKIKRVLGSYWWNALYQQRPSPLGGGVFQRNWFRYVHDNGTHFSFPSGEAISKQDCRRYLIVDTAQSLKTSADFFVVGALYETKNKDQILADVVRTRVLGPDQLGILKREYGKWRPQRIGVEKTAASIGLIEEAKREGLPIQAIDPGTNDKLTRALPMAARYEAGCVYHVTGAAYLDDFETELLAFPNGPNDDQVDMIAYAGYMVNKAHIGAFAF